MKIKLTEAVLNQDSELLFSMFADSVWLSNDPPCIESECVKRYLRESFESSDYYWDEIYGALKFGFSINKNEVGYYFEAPSYITHLKNDPGNDETLSDQILILGFNVNIREKPDIGSRILRKASYEVFKKHSLTGSTPLKVDTYIDGKWWYEIELDNDQVGYVIEDFAGEVWDRCITVERIKGEWKITRIYQPPGC
ncbi:SH3 domain-containing protein [Reichenbachiella ulvae]|uniref:SH3 domain-containing protein n=1 Tax=Reichenbachiella ulvae TaxID=2980104 RepID=A0ABT3CZK4_9BACT|nr:SH3 domain-containing protein [Reichenbachiella ulvae]MCV9389127.1 SH3 domain-containing protein [Reichenbachiella ulvae]